MSDNCLDCPDEQNYAAIALQLQETALEAEACLFAAETALRQVTNPQTIVFNVTGAEPAVLANVLLRIGTSAGTVAFANSPRINMVQGAVVWTPGVWEVGCAITASATGAVTVDSLRELFIQVLRTGTSTTTFSSVITTSEPNDGVGVDMIHSVILTIEAGEEIRFYFRHGNTGSTVQVAAGALYWATRLSDATALRVV